MKRMHVHVSVPNIDNAIGFYSALFATKPAVVKDDYAKWMLDDPRMNFAISTRGREPGLDHLGIQVENQTNCMKSTGAARRQANCHRTRPTTCCYAQSEKSWIDDPAGISWETFFTTGENISYGDGSGEKEARVSHAKLCCASQVAAATEAACCK